ncbi:MAG: LPS export ABC transporter periplasmic protein LptC [Burkholderiales bacterium PBB6]|uniref:LPS export ABC transporter periplasmic protein LptC n=1 Tax=Ideonella margarita TaxID=2984191 RepID=A0ABU9C4Y3_9BURK|nr:MAG: LPS export ABC transporter periplasmic protein LptC [Burkholderiales bacterium PBB6]
MSVELHLPDLPEVPVALPLGPAPGGPRRLAPAWSERLRGVLTTALPLLLMAMLALGTWWLVKHAPQADAPGGDKSARHEPDYRLERFTLQRYARDGALALELEGEHLRHFPDNDELEIDVVSIVAHGAEGRLTKATARSAVASGDGQHVSLMGGAHVVSTAPGTEPVELTGEHIELRAADNLVVADKPIRVQQGASVFSADAMQFNNLTRQLVLVGPARATFDMKARQ